MQQLIKIETVPIQLEMKHTNAKFEPLEFPENLTADMNSPRQVGGAGTQTSGTTTTTVQQVSTGGTDAYVPNIASQSYSDMLSSAVYGRYSGQYESDFSASSAYVQAGIQNTQLQAASTSSGLDSAAVAQNMNAYASDRAGFDASVSLGLKDLKFVPGTLEFEVTQRPEVNIEYIGGPRYVPASANPNYVDTYA